MEFWELVFDHPVFSTILLIFSVIFLILLMILFGVIEIEYSGGEK